MVLRHIIWRVYRMIFFLHMGGLFRDSHWRGDLALAPLLTPAIMVVRRTLPMKSYKMNIDRCVKDGSTSGGDIIRDHMGHCIRAFLA